MMLSGARVELTLAGEAGMAEQLGSARRLRSAQAELPSAALGVDGPTRARGRRRADTFLSQI